MFRVFASLAIASALLVSPSIAAAPSSAELLRKATSWGYQLQGMKVGPLRRSSYDVLVIDAGTPFAGAEYSKADLKRIKRKPDGSRRLVIAYMNVGEAENYRYYWKDSWEKNPPAWMGSENCRWKGDHRVRFWMPEWQRILYGSKKAYLDRLIAMGFDGVFLDRVDIYRYWTREKPDSFSAMVAMVRDMSAYAKQRNPQFLIMPQNGEGLLADASYRAAIDGQAKEDLIFGNKGNGTRNIEWRYVKARDFLAKAQEDGLPLFAIEYLRKPEVIAEASERLKALGYVPYFGPRSLSRLGIDGKEHPEDGQTEPLMDEAKGAAGAC